MAHAGWSVKGSFEPDTTYDLTGWMLTQPDTLREGLQLYFNGFGAVGGPALTTVNPNVATLRTSVITTPFLPVALFGVWKDCNQDGYVGAADQGLLEYSAALLPNDTTCPIRTPNPQFPWTAFNDGAWVVEYVPVGYDDITTSADANPLTINDTFARVWADWGLPGEAASLSCATYPAGHGTFRSTGGLLAAIDCHYGHRVVPAASNAFESAGRPELSFNDAPRDRPDRSRSLLNQRNPWGNESDGSYFYARDCRGTRGPYASPAGTLNETQAALTDCDRSNTGETLDLDRHPDGSDANLPYALEGEEESITPFGPRTRTDHVFTFEEGTRGGPAVPLGLGTRMRGDLGTGAASLTGFWVGTTGGPGAPNPYLTRGELKPASVSYITYYASMTHALGSALGFWPSSWSGGYYGTEGCGRTPATFECDPVRWWRNSAGADITPRDSRLGQAPDDPGVPDGSERTKIGVRVWQHYQRRDVDCIDTGAWPARDQDVHWGTFSSTECSRPPVDG